MTKIKEKDIPEAAGIPGHKFRKEYLVYNDLDKPKRNCGTCKFEYKFSKCKCFSRRYND